MTKLVGEERAAQGLVTTAAAAGFPFHLDQPIVAAKGLVEMGAVAGNRRRPKLEVALVRVFIAAGIKPGVQVWIGDGFFGLVRDHVSHAVLAAYARGRAVGAGELRFTAVGALVNVTDESILNVRAADGGMGMETAVGAAEAGALFYVRGGQDKIDSAGVQWQVMASMCAHDGGQIPVAKTAALRIVVEHGAGKVQMAAHVAGCITIGGVDGFIGGSAQ